MARVLERWIIGARSPLLVSLLLANSVMLTGCSSCSNESTIVPFGLDAGPRHQTEESAQAADTTLEMRSFADGGVEELTIEGAALEFDGRLLAVVSGDLDSDGDQDFIGIVAGEDAVRLQVRMREGATFGNAVNLAEEPLSPGWAALSGSFETVESAPAEEAPEQGDTEGDTENAVEAASAEQADTTGPAPAPWLLARLRMHPDPETQGGGSQLRAAETTDADDGLPADERPADERPADERPADERPADERLSERVWLLSSAAAPTKLLEFGQRAEGARRLRLSFLQEDVDDDGHVDLVMTASLVTDATEETTQSAATLSFHWLDRPSGLALDGAEPETTLRRWARGALRRLGRHPQRALRRSRRVLGLHEALCLESERSTFVMGAHSGLSCGESEAAGRAAATEVRALAVLGQTWAALDASDSLEGRGRRINDERREAIAQALEANATTAGLRLRRSPTIGPHGHEPVSIRHGVHPRRLGALAFLDENRVLLRGLSPLIWDIATDQVSPGPLTESARGIVDPSGAYAVEGVAAVCGGVELVLVPAHLLQAAPIGAQRRVPLIGSATLRSGNCIDTPDEGMLEGVQILGWAPQGVVAAFGENLHVVPLNLNATATGSPRVLAPGDPPPAPLPPGLSTVDGAYRVELRGLGVIRHRVTNRPGRALLWPAGWGDDTAMPQEAAISPSGNRVAVLRGSRIFLIEESGAASPTQPAAPPTQPAPSPI